MSAEPTIADLERTADRLTGHGISGLTPEDWPVLVAALEDYIQIRRAVAYWDDKIKRAQGPFHPHPQVHNDAGEGK